MAGHWNPSNIDTLGFISLEMCDSCWSRRSKQCGSSLRPSLAFYLS